MTAGPSASPPGGPVDAGCRPGSLASVLLAALLPPALLVWLSSRLERRALRDELEARARSAAAVTDALLSHAEAFLARARERAGTAAAAPATAETLRSAVDLGLAVRDASLLDASLAPGVQRRDASRAASRPRSATPSRRDGRALWDGAPGAGAVRFALRLPRGAGQVSFDAARLAAVPRAPRGRRTIHRGGRRRGGDRPPRAGRGGAPHGAGPARRSGSSGGSSACAPRRRRPRCAGGGISVRVRATPDAQLAAWGETLPLLLAIGLGFGAGAAALVLLAGSPGAALTRQLRGALRRGELEVRYLPVVDVRSGRCVGAEALLRWRHAREGLLSPDLFIALAEETGLIVPITDWLMRRVARDLPDGLPDPERFHVSINLAGAHLRDTRTVAAILRAFEGSSLGP